MTKNQKIQCLNCKNLFDVEKGKEFLARCPVCDSQHLRWIIGTFQDGSTLREVRVKRVLPDD